MYQLFIQTEGSQSITENNKYKTSIKPCLDKDLGVPIVLSLFVEPKTQKIERHWETKCCGTPLFTNQK